MTGDPHAPAGVPRSRLSMRDLFDEAIAGITQRPGRSALTALGTVLGVGSLVAILGLTATVTSQVSTRFNALTATEVIVTDTGGTQADFNPNSFASDAEARVARLDGAQSSGVVWPTADNKMVSTSLVGNAVDPGLVTVDAASPGIFPAIDARLDSGRFYDAFHDQAHARVVVIGRGAAAAIGLRNVDNDPVLFIGGIGFNIIGIVGDTDRESQLLQSVFVPDRTAVSLWGQPQQERAHMVISTRIGAAPQVAKQAALALSPEHPDDFKVTPPPDPKSLRTQVNTDLTGLFLVLAALCLVVGTVGIANTTLVAVMERVPEIGLRRSLGATGRHIAVQFVTESATLGVLGGLVGTSVGVTVLVGVAVAKHWTPVIEPWLVVLAPAAGLLTGLVAGLYPSIRAARIEPVAALRR